MEIAVPQGMRSRMKVVLLSVAVVLVATSGCAPRGASSDLRYCAALGQLYMRYVGNPETEPRAVRRNDAAAEDAMAQCRQGNAATSIPVLERKLTDNRITLPSRD
jgi:hypothetical protein